MSETIETIAMQGGEKITFSLFQSMSVHFLKLDVNFNPYPHTYFFSDRLTKIPGIKFLTGVNATGKRSGQFSFLIDKNINIELAKRELKQELSTYFIQL